MRWERESVKGEVTAEQPIYEITVDYKATTVEQILGYFIFKYFNDAT